MTQGAGQGPVVNASVSWHPPQRQPTSPEPAAPVAPAGPAAAPLVPAQPTAPAPGTPVAFPDVSLPEASFPGGGVPFPQTQTQTQTQAQAPLPDAPVAPASPEPPSPSAGYTPTAHDLPVVGRRAQDSPTVQLTSLPDPEDDPPGPLYVVGDVHGYLDELHAALEAQGLIDAEGRWSAGRARLWFLGDFTDRGPDGVGVIDLVMRLSAEAAAAGGYAKALMGNHELLLIGAKKFGDTPVNSAAGTASFLAAWRLNGGQPSDMERLEDHHLAWMSRLDAVALEDDHLLLHSDTTAYLDYGTTIDAVNDAVTNVLQRGDADECWELFRKFTKRFAFRGESGTTAARELLHAYGGRQVVHGHSPIPYLLGEVGAEDDADGGKPAVSGPHLYADDLALAMDGGVTMEGRLLVAQLPLAV
ncbi:metallophosphoesterase [Streptomyces sp. RB6PN25]|uniref:Metallophosphoesterase n=1 Tax=Streptomyces humicola TaxID=2953240 RepID=A0ABT1PZ24_9ACTN|nr:metallophosphoesterase [Streptomyces humicola]MCQ4081770.1 metallophosphoesterase [Streptomyces humicola]